MPRPSVPFHKHQPRRRAGVDAITKLKTELSLFASPRAWRSRRGRLIRQRNRLAGGKDGIAAAAGPTSADTNAGLRSIVAAASSASPPPPTKPEPPPAPLRAELVPVVDSRHAITRPTLGRQSPYRSSKRHRRSGRKTRQQSENKATAVHETLLDPRLHFRRHYASRWHRAWRDLPSKFSRQMIAARGRVAAESIRRDLLRCLVFFA